MAIASGVSTTIMTYLFEFWGGGDFYFQGISWPYYISPTLQRMTPPYGGYRESWLQPVFLTLDIVIWSVVWFVLISIIVWIKRKYLSLNTT